MGTYSKEKLCEKCRLYSTRNSGNLYSHRARCKGSMARVSSRNETSHRGEIGRSRSEAHGIGLTLESLTLPCAQTASMSRQAVCFPTPNESPIGMISNRSAVAIDKPGTPSRRRGEIEETSLKTPSVDQGLWEDRRGQCGESRSQALPSTTDSPNSSTFNLNQGNQLNQPNTIETRSLNGSVSSPVIAQPLAIQDAMITAQIGQLEYEAAKKYCEFMLINSQIEGLKNIRRPG